MGRGLNSHSLLLDLRLIRVRIRSWVGDRVASHNVLSKPSEVVAPLRKSAQSSPTRLPRRDQPLDVGRTPISYKH